MNKRSFVDIWLPLSILAALFVFALAQPRPAEAWDCSNLDVKKTGGFSVEATFKYDALSDEHVELNWGDGSSMSLPTGHDVKRTETHTYAEYGSYSIVLTVFNADKSDKIQCSGSVEFTLPPICTDLAPRQYGDWSKWEVIPGTNTEKRSRPWWDYDANDHNILCHEGVEVEERPCESCICQEPYHRVYGEWSEWEVIPGKNTEKRSRPWWDYDANDHNILCHERVEVEERPLDIPDCIKEVLIEGSWSEWTEWNKSGEGVKRRIRTFTREGISKHGDPQYGGWTSWLREGDWETRSQTITWAGIDAKGQTGPNCDLFEEQVERKIKSACENDNCSSPPTCENPGNSVRTVGSWSDWRNNDDGTQSRSRSITYQVPNGKPYTCPEIEYREIPAPHLGLCYDPEFELEIRQDPQTGFYRAWRIWTDDNGYQLDELDLFRRFRRFDTVAEWMDASIEPNSRCQFVISLRFEGSDQFDLFRFSSYGSSYIQLTDTPDLNEINPEWTPMMWIDFSEANTLYKIHPNSKAVRAKVINGFHLLGDEIDSSTDPTGRLEVFTAEGNLYILDTVENQLYQAPFSGQSPTWTPGMTGITIKNGELIFTLDFATGRRTYGSLGQRIVWAPNRWLAGAAHIDYIAEQRYWKEKETGHNVRRTGTPFHATLEALKSPTLKALYLEHIKSEMTHKPIDWRIDPKMGQTVNMTPVMEWLATLEQVDLLRTTIAKPVGNEPGAN